MSIVVSCSVPDLINSDSRNLDQVFPTLDSLVLTGWEVNEAIKLLVKTLFIPLSSVQNQLFFPFVFEC